MAARRAASRCWSPEKSGPQVLSVSRTTRGAQVVTSAPLGRERLRVVAGRQVSRVPHARCRRRRAADCQQGRRQSAGDAASGCSRSIPPARRARSRRRSIRRQLLVVARQQGDRVRVGAGRRIPRAVLRRRSSPWRSTAARRGRSSIAPGMNVSPQFSPDGTADLLHHDQRAHRHHRAARPGGRRRVGRRTRNVRSYPMNGAWIAEILWAPDSQSLSTSR